MIKSVLERHVWHIKILHTRHPSRYLLVLALFTENWAAQGLNLKKQD